MWIKISKERFESVATVILRVPGFFVVDYWWLHERSKSLPDTLQWNDVVTAVLTNLVLFQGFLLMLLPLPRLVDLYMHYISACLLAAAHVFSHQYIVMEQNAENGEDPNFLKREVAALIIHVLVASLVAFLLDVKDNLGRMLLCMYSLPVVVRLSGFPVSTLMLVHNFASAFMILQTMYYIVIYIPNLFDYLKMVYVGITLASELFGWFGIFVTIWNRLFVPLLLLWFWIIQLVVQMYQYVVVTNHPIMREEWYLILLTCISNICNSPISLAGTCVALAYASYFLLSVTKFYLQGYNAFVIDNVMHSGWTEGVTMVVLALQTSLIDLKMPQRTAVMSIILFIVLSSLIQSMFEITEPIMLALSASHCRTIHKHLRALALCFFLFAFPLYMTYMLCLVFHIDFWMLVVISSCVMTSVQVLGLFVIYVLFLYDAWKKEPWDALDDIVYYARAVTRVLEFVVAVFVVGAGMRESLIGQWSWVNSSVLLIHCYFNVWQRLQAGWKSFLLRREAVRKIEGLPVATTEQLERYNDICVICYTEMKSARITNCNHFFHGTCLRKWLYVQDYCPMCHASVSMMKKAETVKSNERDANVDNAANDNAE